MVESQTQIQFYDLLMNKDDITWKDILYDLVKTNQMDPWDIDVSSLSHQYIMKIKKLQEMDFRLSGKMVLAAAVLLKLKSKKLVGDDLSNFDRMMLGNSDLADSETEIFEDSGISDNQMRLMQETNQLIPKTPQPRVRKVSIYDLVEALQKALEVKQRRLIKPSVAYNTLHEIPDKEKVNITLLIEDIFTQIDEYFRQSKNSKLYFHDLIQSESKQDKVLAFIPLLHLTNQRRVDLNQPEHFGNIEIYKTDGKNVKIEEE